MKLNIHIISHPIIQNLSSKLTNQTLPLNINNILLKELGLLILYEAIRNWIKTYQLTIPQINYKKETIIINPKESFIIISNTLQYLSLIQDIQLILPNSQLKLIENNQYYTLQTNLPEINYNTKIIIITYQIQLKYTLDLLDYFLHKKNIQIDKIRLICIHCQTDQLIEISKKHNKLNIYTTQIINN